MATRLSVQLTRGMNMWGKFNQSTSVMETVHPRVDSVRTEEPLKWFFFKHSSEEKKGLKCLQSNLECRINKKWLGIIKVFFIFWLLAFTHFLFLCLLQKSLATLRTSLWCAGGSSGWRMARCSSTSITRMAAWASLNPPKTQLMTLPRRNCAFCTSLSW